MHNDLVAAGRTKNVTAELLYSTIVKPWCHKRHTAVHVGTLSAHARQLVHYATPTIVKMNPRSFPFVMPATDGDPSVGLFVKTALPSWTASCPTVSSWPIIVDFKRLVG